MTPQGLEQLLLDEGYRTYAYEDTESVLTIGYGYNLIANPQKLPESKVNELLMVGISRDEALTLVLQELSVIEAALPKKLAFWNKLSEARKDVLINMSYNLGVSGLLKFKNTLFSISEGHYEEAARRMLFSKWAEQVKGRAKRLSILMKVGEY